MNAQIPGEAMLVRHTSCQSAHFHLLLNNQQFNIFLWSQNVHVQFRVKTLLSIPPIPPKNSHQSIAAFAVGQTGTMHL
jgi:hypothetical protein